MCALFFFFCHHLHTIVMISFSVFWELVITLHPNETLKYSTFTIVILACSFLSLWHLCLVWELG